MSILVLTAMEVEKKTLISAMKDIHELPLINGSILYRGTLDNRRFFLVESGIGKVNAAMTCALAIAACGDEISLIINSGVAGALLPDQRPCDIVISEAVRYHDVNVCAFGHALGQVPFQPALYNADKEAVQTCFQICEKSGYRVRIGEIVTGDRFIEDEKTVKELSTHFPQALAVEMEGAAVGHVAHRCGKPFLVIRAISDCSDNNAKGSYEKFLHEAAQHSETIVRGFVNAENNT